MARSMPLACTLTLSLGVVSAVPAQPAPPTDSAVQRQPAPASAPVEAARSDRINAYLPAWLRIRGEFRERMEGFQGAGFTASRDDLYWLSRVRVNVAVAPHRLASFHLQVQDARVGKKDVGSTGVPFSSPFDLRMAFLDLGRAEHPVSVRLGRQELVYGDQRLVGHVSWLNTARTFDGARLVVRTRGVKLDIFGTSVVRLLPSELDRSGNGNVFAGVYVSADHVVPRGSVEPYVFVRHDRDQLTEADIPGSLALTTIGLRWTGGLPSGFNYGIETALQRGSVGIDDIEAWAGHYQLRTPALSPLAMRVTAEYNYASGDTDPGDGIRGTFDQLYPTPHDKYGLADQVGWRNIHHLRLGAAFVDREWPLAVNYHSWWLAEASDALYSAGGAAIARVAGGAAGRHVGQELDVQISRALTPDVRLAAGYAHVFAGAFLKEATPGASYSAPYVMLSYVFAGE